MAAPSYGGPSPQMHLVAKCFSCPPNIYLLTYLIHLPKCQYDFHVVWLTWLWLYVWLWTVLHFVTAVKRRTELTFLFLLSFAIASLRIRCISAVTLFAVTGFRRLCCGRSVRPSVCHPGMQIVSDVILVDGRKVKDRLSLLSLSVCT